MHQAPPPPSCSEICPPCSWYVSDIYNMSSGPFKQPVYMQTIKLWLCIHRHILHLPFQKTALNLSVNRIALCVYIHVY